MIEPETLRRVARDDLLNPREDIQQLLVEAADEIDQLRELACWREDDAEEITAEWLEASGFIPQDRARGVSWSYAGLELALWPVGGGRINMGDCWEYFPVPTRGHVRRILAALGMTLKEVPCS